MTQLQIATKTCAKHSFVITLGGYRRGSRYVCLQYYEFGVKSKGNTNDHQLVWELFNSNNRVWVKLLLRLPNNNFCFAYLFLRIFYGITIRTLYLVGIFIILVLLTNKNTVLKLLPTMFNRNKYGTLYSKLFADRKHSRIRSFGRKLWRQKRIINQT